MMLKILHSKIAFVDWVKENVLKQNCNEDCV